MPTYLYTDLKTAVDENLHKKLGNLSNTRALLNRAVRDVALEIDLRSTKRKTPLSPRLYEKVYNYTAPSDLKGFSLIDVRKQIKRKTEFILTTDEEFDRMKRTDKEICAIYDADFVRMLRISGETDNEESIIHDMESLTGDGTWDEVAGTDAVDIVRDVDNFLNGNASIKFGSNSGGATAAIENSTFDDVDLTDFENHDIFVYVYIPATSGLTNFILRWGNDSSNYFSRTVTTTNEGLAFTTGWNLLRFAWSGATETGTVDVAAIDYLRFTITKTAGMAAQTEWRVDYIVARRGDIHDVFYYSKYLWQDSSGTYIENSTADTDLLNVDTEEFNLIVNRATELAAPPLRDYKDGEKAAERYLNGKLRYQQIYPSEAKTLVTTYHQYSSIEGSEDLLMND